MSEEKHEDSDLTAAVRAAFEVGDIGADNLRALEQFAGREARSRRFRRAFFRVAPLVAAAFMIVATFPLLIHDRQIEAASKFDVRATIGLLCEIDGIGNEELVSLSTGDLLLAWQDAVFPERDLLDCGEVPDAAYGVEGHGIGRGL